MGLAAGVVEGGALVRVVVVVGTACRGCWRYVLGRGEVFFKRDGTEEYLPETTIE